MDANRDEHSFNGCCCTGGHVQDFGNSLILILYIPGWLSGR